MFVPVSVGVSASMLCHARLLGPLTEGEPAPVPFESRSETQHRGLTGRPVEYRQISPRSSPSSSFSPTNSGRRAPKAGNHHKNYYLCLSSLTDLGRPLIGDIKPGSAQDKEQLLPGLSALLFGVEMSVYLWTRAGVEEYLCRGREMFVHR